MSKRVVILGGGLAGLSCGDELAKNGHEVVVLERIPYAYPVYDLEYESHLKPIQDYIGGLSGIITTGRQGNFRYNNMDQSVEMGRAVAEEIHTGSDTGHATGHATVATGKEYFG